jgi:peptidyl-prolyl cis-trans isomerase SurA
MIKILTIVNLIIFLTLNASNCFAKKLQNKIIVKIQNEIITEFDIKNKILSTLILANQEVTQAKINSLKNSSINSLVDYKLKKIELSKYNYTADQNRLNNYLNLISSNNINQLKNKFKQQNLDFEQLLNEIKIEFKWQKFIYNNYSKKIDISTVDIEKEINSYIKNQSDIEEISISKIEVLLDNNESDKEKILNLQKMIDQQGFDVVAKTLGSPIYSSDKNEINWINKKSLSKPVFQAIQRLSVGEISEPIIIQNTALILKLNDKRVSKSNNFNKDDLRKKIIEQKKNELFQLYSKSYLSQLKNNILIEYK